MFQRTLCHGCRVAWTTTGIHLDRRENVVWKFGGQILELETCSTIPRKSLDNNDRMLYTVIHKNVAVHLWSELWKILTDCNNFTYLETGMNVLCMYAIYLFILLHVT